GGLTEKLVIAGEKLAQTFVGKQIGLLCENVARVEAQLITAEQKVVQKIGSKLGSYTDDLVEQVVPGKVLRKVEGQLESKAARSAAEEGVECLTAEASVLAKETKSVSDATQGVSKNLSMAEIAQQRLKANDHLLRDFDKCIENLTKQVNKDPVGRLLEATPSPKVPELDRRTELFYNAMRETSKDVDDICKNTGISRDVIIKVKQHVFIEEHMLRHGIEKFFPDADMAAAWNRLKENKYVYSDLKMLQHEYAESLIMQGLEVAYDDAHCLANKLYDWDSTL